MRIVFFGTPELAVPSLKAVAARHDVTALVCQPDKPQGRGRKPLPPPTKVWALEHGIEVNQPAKLNDGTFEAWLREQAPEICVIVAYGRILKQPILDVPTHGFLNVHPSLLPKHRGPAPIQTAILKGDRETGVTIMRLDAGTDTGDILLSKATPIAEDDTAETLSHKLADLGAKLLVEALDLVESGEAVFVPQDNDLATYTKMFDKEDARIPWERSAEDIHNMVRAFQPWPVAYTVLDGETLRIHKTRVAPEPRDGSPGTVIEVNKDEIVVAAGQGAIAIQEIQAPGKRAMPAADFLRGRPIDVGTRFEDA